MSTQGTPHARTKVICMDTTCAHESHASLLQTGAARRSFPHGAPPQPCSAKHCCRASTGAARRLLAVWEAFILPSGSHG